MNQKHKSEVAKLLNLLTDKSQKDICSILDCTEKTFSFWKQKGNWSKLRELKTITNQQVITLLKEQLLKLVEKSKDEGRLLSNAEIDLVSKLTSSIDKIEKAATIETYIEVFEEYTKWLLTENVEFAKANNLFQDKFIQRKIKED